MIGDTYFYRWWCQLACNFKLVDILSIKNVARDVEISITIGISRKELLGVPHYRSDFLPSSNATGDVFYHLLTESTG